MRYAITGATGLLGNNLTRKLLDQGHQVRVAIRPDSDRRPLQGLDVSRLVGDLSDESLIQDLVHDVDGLFHSAALIWIGKTRLAESRLVNVEMTRTIARVCRQQSIKMVHISTVDALAASRRDSLCNESDVDPAKAQCAYVISKREAEQVVQEQFAQGLQGCIVNPGFFIGPFDWKPSSGEMILAIARQWVPLAPGGGFSVADVRDIAEGVINAMMRGRTAERYILGGTNMPYVELFRRIAKVTGGRPPLRGMQTFFARTVGFVGDGIGRIMRRELQVNSAALQMGQLYQYYDSGKAIAELDYRIGDIDVAIRDAWEWFLENGYAKPRKRP